MGTVKTKDSTNAGRRKFLKTAGTVVAILVLASLPLTMSAQDTAGKGRMKIGIIGSGRIGGTVGTLWVKAGHEVLFSSRHPDQLKELVDGLGPAARTGTPLEAAVFGEVVLVSVPYHAVPQIGRDLAGQLAGKVVLETETPIRYVTVKWRWARNKGMGLASAETCPVCVSSAPSTRSSSTLRSEAHRAGDRIAIPLAGDDREALAVASRLVKDAGFEPVVVGPLARAKDFDIGTSVYARGLTARELRKALGIDP
jgi:predicted dinucleotide-binding enzyme